MARGTLESAVGRTAEGAVFQRTGWSICMAINNGTTQAVLRKREGECQFQIKHPSSFRHTLSIAIILRRLSQRKRLCCKGAEAGSSTVAQGGMPVHHRSQRLSTAHHFRSGKPEPRRDCMHKGPQPPPPTPAIATLSGTGTPRVWTNKAVHNPPLNTHAQAKRHRTDPPLPQFTHPRPFLLFLSPATTNACGAQQRYNPLCSLGIPTAPRFLLCTLSLPCNSHATHTHTTRIQLYRGTTHNNKNKFP